MHAITLTLRPKYYSMSLEEQLHLSSNEIKALNNVQYHVIAELTPNYNIHYHGVIQIVKPNKYSLLRQLYDITRKMEIIGFCCIKPLDDYEVWQSYIYKDYDKTNADVNSIIELCNNDEVRVSRPLTPDKKDNSFSFELKSDGSKKEIPKISTKPQMVKVPPINPCKKIKKINLFSC